MLSRRETIEMWMLLEQAVCSLKDLQEGNVSPKEESVPIPFPVSRNFGNELDQRLLLIEDWLTNTSSREILTTLASVSRCQNIALENVSEKLKTSFLFPGSSFDLVCQTSL